MSEPKYFNPWKQFVGSWLPRWLEERRELSPGAKMTYARLASYAGQRGVAYPKQPEMARALGIARRTVQKYLEELRAAGLIEVRQRGTRKGTRAGRAAEYRFLETSWTSGGRRKTGAHTRAQQSPTGAHTHAQQSVPNVRGSRARGLFESHTPAETQRSAPRAASRQADRSRDTEKPKGRGYGRAQALVAGVVAGIGGTDNPRRSGNA